MLKNKVFLSFKNHNYRNYFLTSAITGICDASINIMLMWVILTDLTHHDEFTLGLCLAVASLPAILLFPLIGFAVNKFGPQKVIISCTILKLLCSCAFFYLLRVDKLAVIEVSILMFLFGFLDANAGTAKQIFVMSIVAKDELVNAVSLNSISFQICVMVSPFLGIFFLNSLPLNYFYFIYATANIIFLIIIFGIDDTKNLQQNSYQRPIKNSKRRLFDLSAVKHIFKDTRLKILFTLIILFAAFVYNFNQIYLTKFTFTIFGENLKMEEQHYDTLVLIIAIGSICGAMLVAIKNKTKLKYSYFSSTLLGAVFILFSFYENLISIFIEAFFIGFLIEFFVASTTTYIQLVADKKYIENTMAFYNSIQTGAKLPGGIIAGFLAQKISATTNIMVLGIFGMTITTLLLIFHIKNKHIQINKIVFKNPLKFILQLLTFGIFEDNAPDRGQKKVKQIKKKK